MESSDSGLHSYLSRDKQPEFDAVPQAPGLHAHPHPVRRAHAPLRLSLIPSARGHSACGLVPHCQSLG